MPFIQGHVLFLYPECLWWQYECNEKQQPKVSWLNYKLGIQLNWIPKVWSQHTQSCFRLFISRSSQMLNDCLFHKTNGIDTIMSALANLFLHNMINPGKTLPSWLGIFLQNRIHFSIKYKFQETKCYCSYFYYTNHNTFMYTEDRYSMNKKDAAF